MAKHVCSNCGHSQEADESCLISSVTCTRCGYLLQVKLEDPKPSSATAKIPPAKKTAISRAVLIAGFMYAVFAVFLPISYMNAKTSTPLCLIAFAVNLIVGTASGFFFLSGMNDPDYLTEWLQIKFTRLSATAIFLPLFILAYLVAYFSYSP